MRYITIPPLYLRYTRSGIFCTGILCDFVPPSYCCLYVPFFMCCVNQNKCWGGKGSLFGNCQTIRDFSVGYRIESCDISKYKVSNSRYIEISIIELSIYRNINHRTFDMYRTRFCGFFCPPTSSRTFDFVHTSARQRWII